MCVPKSGPPFFLHTCHSHIPHTRARTPHMHTHTTHTHTHTHTHTQWFKHGGVHCLCALSRRAWVSCTVSKTFLDPLLPRRVRGVRKCMYTNKHSSICMPLTWSDPAPLHLALSSPTQSQTGHTVHTRLLGPGL